MKVGDGSSGLLFPLKTKAELSMPAIEYTHKKTFGMGRKKLIQQTNTLLPASLWDSQVGDGSSKILFPF